MSAPPLVLLHGWGLSARIWSGLRAVLPDGLAVHAPDLPGHGAAPAATAATLEAWGEGLLAAMPERAALCGWSLGGLIALELALRHPQRFARLVLIGTSPRFVAYAADAASAATPDTASAAAPDAAPDAALNAAHDAAPDAAPAAALDVALDAVPDAAPRTAAHAVSDAARAAWPHGLPPATVDGFMRDFAADAAATLRRFVALQTLGDARRRAVGAALGDALSDCVGPRADALADGLELLAHADLRPRLAQLQLPVELIHGAGDALMPVEAARWLARQWPQARLSVFDDCGHAPFLSRPSDCAALIAKACDDA